MPMRSEPSPTAAPSCSATLTAEALPGVPWVGPGTDLGELIADCAGNANWDTSPTDIWVISSKVVSRAEGRSERLRCIEPSDRARTVAAETAKDPRLVELILRESDAVSRAKPGVLITRHRLGIVSANAAIDQSNVRPRGELEDSGRESETETPDPSVLLLPRDPDASARRIRDALAARFGSAPGVVVSDSLGRPFRFGTVGVAIGVAGLEPLCDYARREDLVGRVLEHTVSGFADEIAATAGLVSGQGAEGRAVVRLRGLVFSPPERDVCAREICRSPDEDLYA